MFRARLGVRARILAIALIPSLTLLVVGVGATGYLIDQGQHDRQVTEAMRAASGPTRTVYEIVQNERRLTLAYLAGDSAAADALAAVRPGSEQALRGLLDASQQLRSLQPDQITDDVGSFATLIQQLGNIRGAVDSRAVSAGDAYTFYARLLDALAIGAQVSQSFAPDAHSATQLTLATRIMHMLEATSRSRALAGAALQSGRPVALPEEYIQQTGFYHTESALLARELAPELGERLNNLLSSPQWQLLTRAENTLIARSLSSAGNDSSGLPPAQFAAWQDAAGHLDHEMLELWDEQNTVMQQASLDAAARTTTQSLLIGLAVLVISAAAFGISLVLANRFIHRLVRLRDHTLALADERLPDILDRLRAGEDIDDAATAARLDFGHDELGAVATAFEHAHAVAVTAAVTEARNREGVKSIFLNIAHRSQIVVHKQLEILDEAERREEDPAMLDVLFKLDHLATRERRNAENLIVLGGGKPGRQWRTPVPLVDLVRSAVGETQDYPRVRLARLPELRVAGSAVGDLIHLLAELVDNATSFSPPQSRVQVTGSVIGKGVAVEITDQGMGIPADSRDRLNEILESPPDFEVASLQRDSRLGIFVVAQLAHRHGISVRLWESEYGGVRAVVIIPSALLTDPAEETAPLTGLTRPAAPVPPPAPEERAETPTATLVEDRPRPAARPEPAPPDVAAAETGATTGEPKVLPDGRPALPRRARQAKVAPRPEDSGAQQAAAARPRSAEQARDLMAAIENGTRQGRRPLPATDSGAANPAPDGISPDEQEG
ncbi:sensor histidine kinase [Nocardia speluncae]|uniref:histidine kinase n=1 Tax=Nocardia speluncae TaxID=419477 RepID=A0A846XCK7_9NOCA|nr:nitrate- and nitrite sensing domain-containing protein [Nocardia speluncae]NKY32373.1 sensor histidine kinase [Nocardia speluncae]